MKAMRVPSGEIWTPDTLTSLGRSSNPNVPVADEAGDVKETMSKSAHGKNERQFMKAPFALPYLGGSVAIFFSR